jgi:hypothetical protein
MRTKIISSIAALATVAALAAPAVAGAATLTVLGTDDIFAAGLGSPPASDNGGGTLPSSFAVHGGETLIITATGTINCCSGASGDSTGPDGFASNPFGTGSHITNSTGSAIGNYDDAVGAFALAGAFTGGSASTTVFKIGSSDTLVVPTGATLLYFGLPDANGFNGPSGFYGDNSGSFTVDISAAPEPATWAVMLAGFGGLGAVIRRRRKVSLARA